MRNFPMRTFTVLVINLCEVSISKINKRKPIQRTIIQIRNSYPVGLGNWNNKLDYMYAQVLDSEQKGENFMLALQPSLTHITAVSLLCRLKFGPVEDLYFWVLFPAPMNLISLTDLSYSCCHVLLFSILEDNSALKYLGLKIR